MSLPKTVYVWEEEDEEDSWLIANYERRDFAEADKPKLVGTYKLVETGTVSMDAVYKKHEKA